MTNKVELGDFQTPNDWAELLTKLLSKLGVSEPTVIIEPTCGIGAFVKSAISVFPNAHVFGFDINQSYVDLAKIESAHLKNVNIICDNFFNGKYSSPLNEISGQVLFLGNPPWVTNSKLGVIGGQNLPVKNNRQALKGIEAIMGKSNFDISEWMICRLLDILQWYQGTVAMICKSSVARKVLSYAALRRLKFGGASFIPLDSKEVFNVAVDCGFFVFNSVSPVSYEVELFDLSLGSIGKLGDRNGRLVSDILRYDQWSFLDGMNIEKWRSGIKHDCSSVFEFQRRNNVLFNGNGEVVDLECEFLYPFLKSSDLANGRTLRGDRFVLITQKAVGQDTSIIKAVAPKTWSYLMSHRSALGSRKSSIYRNKPSFSIFGVGPYSFAPWKIAISGLYKSLNFVKLSPQNGKPLMLDDTCYFLPCESEAKADAVVDLLSSSEAKGFLQSIIFWDAKRPLNADILQRLNLGSIPHAAASLYLNEVKKGSDRDQISLSL